MARPLRHDVTVCSSSDNASARRLGAPHDAPITHDLDLSALPMSYTRWTTIDQHRGENSLGLHRLELSDIVTDLTDWADHPYEELAPEEREWWDSVLDDVHAAAMEIALLDAKERHLVEDALLEGDECKDLGGLATHLRDTMADVLADLRD